MAVEWKKVHVFISSTFKDMHAERDYLVKRVFPKLNEWCERRRLRLVDIDLRWGVTEQDAQNRNVIKVCLDGIDACRPFFLCFLGQRRGWVPKYDSSKNDKENEIPLSTIRAFPDLAKYAGSTSATELEIIHALVDPLHRGKQRDPKKPGEYYEPAKFAFFYLREDSYLKEIDQSQLCLIYTNENKDDDRELEKWRTEKIPATGRPKHSYSTRWDPELSTPELGLPGRLTNFQCQASPLDEIILQDLQEAIAARYPDHVESDELTDLQKELDQQEQFLYASSEGFIARGDDFKGLDEYVQGPSDRLFVLTAPAGMGKSTLLANWIERYRSDPHINQTGESIHYRFIGQSDRSTTVYSLLRMLLRELKEVAGKVTDEIPDDPQKLRQELPNLLEAAGRKGKTIIVLDALNQLTSGLSDLSWLLYQLPANIKLIVSFKSDDPGAEDLLQQMQGQVIHSQVDPFDEVEDRRRLVNEYLKQYLKALDESHLEILINSKGAERPLFLKVVLSELRVFGAFENLREKIRSDFGETPVSAFEGVLKRLENDPAYSPIKPEQAVPLIFGLLAHAQQGLSAEELIGLLIQALGMDDNEASRQAASDSVYLFLRQVRPFLAHRDGRYDFFFENFKIAVQERYVTVIPEEPLPKRTSQAWHRLLAEYFTPQPLYLDQEKKKPNLRKLTEMVYQQAWAGLGAQVAKTLLDYTYLEAKLSGQGVQELIEDYTLVPKAGVGKEKEKSLSLLQGALRLSAHVLGKDLLQLPSQLTGRLVGFEESDLRGLLEQIRRDIKYPWLRPLLPCFTPPGGPERFTLAGHSFFINSIAITPDGRFVVSASKDKTLKVWGLETGEEKFTLTGHSEGVSEVVITPDGRLAISGSEDGILKVWDLKAGNEKFTLSGHTAPIKFIATTPDSRLAVSSAGDDGGRSDPSLKVWNLQTGEDEFTLAGHKRQVTTMSVTQDGRLAVSGSEDKTLKVWDLQTGEEKFTLAGHTSWVSAMAITPDGRLAVSGACSRVQTITRWNNEFVVVPWSDQEPWSKDYSLRVWDLETGEEKFTLLGHTGDVRTVVITPDGRLAVSSSEDKTIKVWDLETGSEKFTLCGNTDPIRILVVTPDSRLAVSSAGAGDRSWDVKDHSLKVWDLQTGEEKFTLAGHKDCVSRITITPDGRLAISGSVDKSLKVWNLETGEEEITLSGHTGMITGIAITPDGQLLVSQSYDNTLKVWDLNSGKKRSASARHDFGVRTVVITPDERLAVSIAKEMEPFCGLTDFSPYSSLSGTTIKVWDLETGSELQFLPECAGYFNIMTITPGGRLAVSASKSDTLKVWDIETGTLKFTLTGSYPIAVTPNGQLAVSGSKDNRLKVWDLETGEEKFTLPGSYPISITPDGQWLVSVLDNRTLKVWDLETGEEKFTLAGHTDEVRITIISPDGQLAVSGSKDNRLKVWDLETGEEKFTLPGSYPISITPDGQWLVSKAGYPLETLKVWDLKKGNEKFTLVGHIGPINGLAITPDGRFAISAAGSSFHGNKDDTLKVWDLEKGICIATYYADASFECSPGLVAEPFKIIIGDETGQMYFLKMEELNLESSLATIWVFQSLFAFGCPYCRTWSEISESVIGGQIPCPNCGKPVKLNPFTIQGDWKPIAKAWQKSENKE